MKAALPLVILLLTAMPSGATQIRIGGTSRGVYFQHMVNGFARHMPVPPGKLDVYIGTAPGPSCTASVAGAGDEVAACTIPPSIEPNHRPAIRLNAIAFQPLYIDDLQQSFAHEIGHVELDFLTDVGGILNDADRAAFDSIWRRPTGLGWWQPITNTCELGGVGPDPQFGQICGEGSDAAEWAADAYALCATGHWRRDYDNINTGYLPDFGYRTDEVSDMRARRAPILASCGLFRRAARRSAAAASTGS